MLTFKVFCFNFSSIPGQDTRRVLPETFENQCFLVVLLVKKHGWRFLLACSRAKLNNVCVCAAYREPQRLLKPAKNQHVRALKQRRSVSPTRYCQRWPQNPSNRCELFDVQQPPELTVELSTTQSGRMQEHSSSPSTERFPSQRALQRTESDTHRIWLAELQVYFSPRATMERGLVPRPQCRAGSARPAVPRQLGGPLRCSRRCCRSYPRSSLPLCALHRRQTCHCLHHTDDRARHHKCCGLLTELRRISL